MCGRGSRPQPKCQVCGRSAVALCDYPITDTETCDAGMCSEHGERVRSNKDYCPAHAAQQQMVGT